VRVLRHLDFSRLPSITALTAGCCPVWLSPPGKLLTQEPPSQFLLAAPGIPSCATWRTLASLRVSRVCASVTLSTGRCPSVPSPRSLLVTRWREPCIRSDITDVFQRRRFRYAATDVGVIVRNSDLTVPVSPCVQDLQTHEVHIFPRVPLYWHATVPLVFRRQVSHCPRGSYSQPLLSSTGIPETPTRRTSMPQI
jgi:hypothetical protein